MTKPDSQMALVTITDDNPFSVGGRKRTAPPDRVCAIAFEFAKTAPRLKDIAARFGVSQKIFKGWCDENPHILLAIDSAKSLIAEQVLEKQRERAEAGDQKAVQTYLTAHRPDLVKPENEIAIAVQAKISVMPQPLTAEQYAAQQGVVLDINDKPIEGKQHEPTIAEIFFSKRADKDG